MEKNILNKVILGLTGNIIIKTVVYSTHKSGTISILLYSFFFLNNKQK
jgi:hypothetical protein